MAKGTFGRQVVNKAVTGAKPVDRRAIRSGRPAPDLTPAAPEDGSAHTASSERAQVQRSGYARHHGAISQATLNDTFLPRRWAAMGPVIAALGGLLALRSAHLPSAAMIGIMALAVAGCVSAPFISRLQSNLPPFHWQRYPVLLFSVAGPMFAYGLVTASWTVERHNLDWDLTVSSYVVVAVVAIALFDGRMVSMVLATLALWSGALIYAGSLQTYLMLAMSGIFGLYVGVRHARAGFEADAARAERELAQARAEELLSEYEDSGQGWFWETDRRGQITYVSPQICAHLLRDPVDVVGRPFTSLFMLEAQEQESERTLVFHLSTRSSFKDLPVLAASPAREERWWSITGRPVLDPFDNFMGFRGSGTDLTERRRSEQHVTQLARFDSLTKLANRFQMSEWLEKVLSSPRVENKACAVFLLDLDRFKQVNDTMGHPAGDALLVQVADRLRSTVSNLGQVGRLGGDEFQVILHGHHQREGLAHLARRIIDTLSQPYSIDGARVIIGTSVGVAVCPDDGVTSEALIRNADLALYAAKGGGRGRHHFYDDDLHSDAKERQQFEEDLRDAIATGGFELHYQPQVHTTSERITGFEALLRWNHPRHGYISPAKFVPIAEDAGLVSQIGEWALRTACHDMSAWPREVRVAVNVSPLQFANPALPAIVASAIASAGIEAGRLELEITESVFLGEDKNTEAMFSALKNIGVRLALDDFGTGYSSLGYLKKAPFDKIKIDQSFVRGATMEGSRNGAIIASIVNLAEALGMETTAEGVETFDELDLVRKLGCSHVQGYIYEKPLESKAASRRLAMGLSAIAQGPRSARAPRQTMLRKVVLEHGDHRYEGTVRNISQSGAMIEGLWNVPEGTEFIIHLAPGCTVKAQSRWCREDRLGVKFARPLDLDASGAVQFTPAAAAGERPNTGILRKAG